MVFAGLYVAKALLVIPPLDAPVVILGYLAFLRRCAYAADAGAIRLTDRQATRAGLLALSTMVGEPASPRPILGL